MQYKDLPNPSLRKVLDSISLLSGNYSLQNPLRITIFGFFGMNNFGDDIILYTEIQQLKELKIPIDVYIPSRYPENIKNSFNVNSFRFGNFPRLLQNLFNSDLVILGGGGLFCKPSKKLTLKVKITDSLFTIYKVWSFIILPKLLKKKVVIFGVGFYDNQSKFSLIFNLLSFKLVDYISVRDRHSFNILKKLLPNKKIHFQKDIAFSYTIDNALNYKVEKKTNKSKIGISLVPVGNGFILNNLITCIADLINKYNTRFDFYFFPFNTNPGEINDLFVAKKIHKLLKKNVNLIIVNKHRRPAEYIGLFKKLDFAICMRFHAQVFAYIHKIPFIGLSYDLKCKSFLEDIEAFYMDYNHLDISKFRNYIENKFILE